MNRKWHLQNIFLHSLYKKEAFLELLKERGVITPREALQAEKRMKEQNVKNPTRPPAK